MQQSWPACRSAKGGLYTWSQSTPNSIILERVSCVSNTERLFTCAEPRCYFASPSVFIMMALFCLLVRGEVTNMPWLDPVSFCHLCFQCSFSLGHNLLVFRSHLCPVSGSPEHFPVTLCAPDVHLIQLNVHIIASYNKTHCISFLCADGSYSR